MLSYLVSEPPVEWIWTAAYSVCAISLALAVGLLLNGYRQQRQRALASRLEATWRTWLSTCLLSEAPAPKFPTSTRGGDLVVRVWLSVLSTNQGSLSQELIKAAYETPLPRFLHKRLSRPWGARAEDLANAAYLGGLLRVRELEPSLLKLLTHRAPAVVYAASQAAVQTNPRQFIRVLLTTKPLTWAASALLGLMSRVPVHVASAAMDNLILEGTPSQAAKCLTVWARLPTRDAHLYTTSRVLPNKSAHPELLCAALRVVDEHAMVPRLVELLEHPAWQVRLQAIQAVARLGSAKDMMHVRALPESDNWWIKKRAASAMARISGMRRGPMRHAT